jgi:hypothetical protein
VSVLDGEWRKSTRSNGSGACVEARRISGSVQLRDTKDRSGPTLSFTVESWVAFIAAVRGGEFDPAVAALTVAGLC